VTDDNSTFGSATYKDAQRGDYLCEGCGERLPKKDHHKPNQCLRVVKSKLIAERERADGNMMACQTLNMQIMSIEYERDALKEKLDHYTRLSESCESLGGELRSALRRMELEEKVEKLEKENNSLRNSAAGYRFLSGASND